MGFFSKDKNKAVEAKTAMPSETVQAKSHDLAHRLEAFKPKIEDRIPATQRTEISDIRNTLDKASGALIANSPAPTPVPSSDESGNAALLQKQSNQDKTQSALSPTDHAKGKAIAPPKRGRLMTP